jgi:hypothetical protein
MRPLVPILGASVVALCLACSPHEFNDPTGATSKILFQQTPGTPSAPPQQGVPPAAPSPPALAPATSSTRDVVELTTGERIEGTVVQTTATELVIEVGGTTVTFARDRVKTVFYGRR